MPYLGWMLLGLGSLPLLALLIKLGRYTWRERSEVFEILWELRWPLSLWVALWFVIAGVDLLWNYYNRGR